MVAGSADEGRMDEDRWQPFRELRESFFLIALTVSTMSAYIGVGALAVRLFAAR